MQILIVEDDVRLARALAHILEENGYGTDVVHNGADGLAYAESDIYDVVILDVMLPKMDGFTAVSYTHLFIYMFAIFPGGRVGARCRRVSPTGRCLCVFLPRVSRQKGRRSGEGASRFGFSGWKKERRPLRNRGGRGG